MKLYIDRDGQIFVAGKLWGHHADGLMYQFNAEGWSMSPVAFNDRLELEALIRERTNENVSANTDI